MLDPLIAKRSWSHLVDRDRTSGLLDHFEELTAAYQSGTFCV
jgi:hypothetical protein